MADALASPPPTAAANAPEVPRAHGDLRARISAAWQSPALRRSLPALGGLAALATVGVLYLALASGPQRVLYSQLSDSERAQVVETLERGGIDYAIDPATGMISVSQDELYRARMLVASDGALAAPESATQLLDSIPLGASRKLEGERLKLARERELMLTILEIDGIEAARVHLAMPERSVFLRENAAPSASVMVRLARGRTLAGDQVDAIVNLVAASVPGLDGSAVRVVDQTGQLLSGETDPATGTLALQREFEAKLRGQLAKLLVPLLGEGNFSSEVQIELDREELTSARESYDPQGVVRRESESRAVTAAGAAAGGIPGALSNTPPPPAELVEEAPQGTPVPGGEDTATDSHSTAQRDYAIGREVAVSSVTPGGIARLSVAVAVSEKALRAIAPADETKLQSLIEAAVGANPARGDKVTVVVGKFEPLTIAKPPFYEAPWFAMALRYGSAVLAVLLALLLGVRPLLAALRGQGKAGHSQVDTGDGPQPADGHEELHEIADTGGMAKPLLESASLREQVTLAQKLALEQPERAVGALRRMLAAPEGDIR